MEAAAPTDNTFYIQIQYVKENFVRTDGAPGEADLPLVTLPPGTVLFRGLKIPNPVASGAGSDPRYFYRDYLGTPEGKDTVCLDPNHNTFFYPFPYVAFGAHNVGKTFHLMQAVVLVHPMTVVAAIAPSLTTRSSTVKQDDNAPWLRCSQLKDYMCHEQSEKELEALSFDACLHPKYQLKTNVRGWMALADLDSIRSRKQKKEAKDQGTSSTSTMASFLHHLEEKDPGLGAETLCWLYMDKEKRRVKLDAEGKQKMVDGVPVEEEIRARRIGFPEVALYPYRVHSGPKPITRKLRTTEDAIFHMAEEAKRNNLNYLPLAAFTKDGITDMVNGHFTINCLGASEDVFTVPIVEQQDAIVQKVHQWLDMVQTTGIDLPHYGKTKLQFDTRTGFFVLREMVPAVLRVPVPASDAKEDVTGGVEKKADIPYRFLLLPLDTDVAKAAARRYMILFRNFFPDKAMQKVGLAKGFGVHRAMVFERPPAPLMEGIFKEVGITMPKSFEDALRDASKLYRDDMGRKGKKDVAASLATVQMPTMLGVEGAPDQNFFFYNATGERVAAYSRETLYALKPEQIRDILVDGDRTESAEEDQQVGRIFWETASADTKSKIKYLYSYAFLKRGVPEDQVDSFLPKLLLDDVCMYSVTESEMAEQMAVYIREELANAYGGDLDSAKNATITDATACAGGNAIAFCDTFKYVNAVDNSPNRAMMCHYNLALFNYTSEKYSVHCADYRSIMRNLQQDVVFFDPPWGGPNYKNQTNLTLKLGDTNLVDIVTDLYNEGRARVIAIKAPENYDEEVLLTALNERVAASTVAEPRLKTIPMKGMKLLIVYSIPPSEEIIPTPMPPAFDAAEVEPTDEAKAAAQAYFEEQYGPLNKTPMDLALQPTAQVTEGISRGGRRLTRRKSKGLQKKTRRNKAQIPTMEQHAMAKEFPRVWSAFLRNVA